MTDQPTTPDRDEQRFAVRAFGLWWLVTVAWWAFAFVPFGLELPALQRAQQVCFGTRPDGLPDAWGWGLLLVGPGSMLGFLLVVWGSALIAGLRAAWRGGFGKAAAAVAMLLLAGNLALIGRAVVATARIEAATQAIAADELPPSTHGSTGRRPSLAWSIKPARSARSPTRPATSAWSPSPMRTARRSARRSST